MFLLATDHESLQHPTSHLLLLLKRMSDDDFFAMAAALEVRRPTVRAECGRCERPASVCLCARNRNMTATYLPFEEAKGAGVDESEGLEGVEQERKAARQHPE